MSLCCPSGVIKNNNNNNNYAVPYKTQRQHTEFNEQHVDQMHHVYMHVHRSWMDKVPHGETLRKISIA